MPIIHINVKEKIAKGNKDEFIVCNNSDYEILFDFDNEWQEYNHKTAIVTLSNREFVPILFDGNKCKLPPLQNATFCKIGVMASLENDDATIRISTTTPANINCLESAYDENGEILPPTDDIYQQILAKLNEINLEQEPYNELPLMDGVANAGSRKEYARGDHRHPRDKTKLDLIEPLGIEQDFVMVVKDRNGYYQTQKTGSYTPSKSYLDFVPVLRGLQGQIKGQTPPTANQTDLDLINRKELTDKLGGKLDKATSVVGGFNLYGTKYNDTTTQMWKIDNGNATQDRIPMYYTADNTSVSENGKGVLVTSTPSLGVHATNKNYVDTGLDGKVDKVTTAYRIYGTDDSGNQKAYATGYSPTSGNIQILDYTPNGGYTDDGDFKNSVTGTIMVGIPNKPAHATPKKWVEDNFTVYKHTVSVEDGDTGSIPVEYLVFYSTSSTPIDSDLGIPQGTFFGGPEGSPYIYTNNGDTIQGFVVNTDISSSYWIGSILNMYVYDVVTKL